MAETILLEVTDGVALLTLNQPARRNPMSERMGEELAEALRGVEAREDVRVLILAGAWRARAVSCRQTVRATSGLGYPDATGMRFPEAVWIPR